jgi:hypothetical protein
MPVALVVVCVIFVKAVLTVSVGVDEAAPAEHGGGGVALTVILPVAFTLPHPPVRGIS